MRRALLFGLLSLVGVSGCTSAASFGECVVDVDCPSGTLCRRGTCGAPCSVSSECGQGQACLLGACAPQVAGGGDVDVRRGDAPGGRAVWYGLDGSEFARFDIRVSMPPATGGVSRSGQAAEVPHLAMDSADNPVVVWHRGIPPGFTRVVHLRRYDGSRWTGLGGSATDEGLGGDDVLWPRVAVNGSDQPVVAWLNRGATPAIYVRTYMTDWVELEGSATGNGTTLGLPVDSRVPFGLYAGAQPPAVAWGTGVQGGNQADIAFTQPQIGGWSELDGSALGGGLSNSTAESLSPVVTTDATGNVVVAWAESQNGNPTAFEIRAVQHNGTVWAGLAGSDASGIGISDAAGETAVDPQVASGTNGPIVAWSQGVTPGTTERRIVVAEFNGTLWQTLGGGAVGPAISTAGHVARRPSLGVLSTGEPVVAWQDEIGGVTEVYLKRYDGADWVEHNGSGSGGGVSNSALRSIWPSLGVGATRMCVAWEEAREVLVRCSDVP